MLVTEFYKVRLNYGYVVTGEFVIDNEEAIDKRHMRYNTFMTVCDLAMRNHIKSRREVIHTIAKQSLCKVTVECDMYSPEAIRLTARDIMRALVEEHAVIGSDLTVGGARLLNFTIRIVNPRPGELYIDESVISTVMRYTPDTAIILPKV